MVEYAPSGEKGAGKRRSTRIVQAVPITVTGTDALGQPFKERTSTLIINCHGFKFQSKHYVLKGSWLDVEVPSTEPGKEARSVRGCVTFVQRPRTVRELFQVGVELETPGNVWGVAFPPSDWFAYGEGPVAVPSPGEPETQPGELGPTLVSSQPFVPPAVAPELPKAEVSRPAPVPRAAPPAAEAAPPVVPRPAEPPAAHLPSPAPPAAPGAHAAPPAMRPPMPEGLAAEVPMAAARQWSRIVAEAQVQLQRQARESVSAALSSEVASLTRDLSGQLRDAAMKALDAAAADYVDQVTQQALNRIEDLRRSVAKDMQAAWNRQFEQDVADTRKQLAARLAETAEGLRREFGEQVKGGMEVATSRLADVERHVQELGRTVAESAADLVRRSERLRAEFDAAADEARARWGERVAAQVQESMNRLAEIEQSARRVQEQYRAASDAAQAEWRAKWEQDHALATARFEGLLRSLVSDVQSRLVNQAEQISAGAAEQLRQSLELKLASARRGLEESVTTAEQRAAMLDARLQERVSRGNEYLSRVEAATSRIEEHMIRLDSAAEVLNEEIRRRFDALLTANSAELKSRVETMLTQAMGQLLPSVEARAEEFVARTGARLEKQLSEVLPRAEETLEKLATREARVATELREERDTLRSVADDAARKAMADLQAMVEQLRTAFEESCRSTVTRCIEEVENKTSETSHATFEALYRSSEWYQKKAFMAMQSAMDKATAEASAVLRDKAAELSGVFASELAHYSRSYVDHTREQLEDAKDDAISIAREQFKETMETTTARFDDEAHALAEQKSRVFGEAAEGAAREILERLQKDTERLNTAFVERLESRVQTALESAAKDLHEQLKPVVEAWRSESQIHQQELLEALGRHSSGALAQYKERLENVSNTWIVAAVSQLTQSAQASLDSLARTGVERMRESCAGVLAGLGELVRERLTNLSAILEAPPPESNE